MEGLGILEYGTHGTVWGDDGGMGSHQTSRMVFFCTISAALFLSPTVRPFEGVLGLSNKSTRGA